MVLYYCKCCNFSSKLFGNYKRHIKTKKHGRNIDPDYKIENEMALKSQKEPKKSQKEPEKSQKEPQKTQKDKKFNCDHCINKFSSYAHKRRHELHRCKKNPYSDKKIINKEIKKLEKEKYKLEKKVDKLTEKIGDTTNIQNNNNNIHINSYGNEDISHITDAFKTHLLCGPYGAIQKMIKAIHFNDKKPENKNVKLPNLNKNILKIKKGENWIHKNKDMILLDMIDSKYLMLDDHFNLIVNGEILSKYKKDIYIKFRDKYDDGDKDLLNNLKNECEMVLLDNRESN